MGRDAPRALPWLALAPLIGLALILIPLLLIGLPRGDAEQGRLCRQLIPALLPVEKGIEVTNIEGGTGAAVHVAFRLAGEARDRLITCRFGGAGYSAAKRDLVAIILDGRGIGETAFYFLKERWLETPDAILADPGPPGRGKGWITVSNPAALALQHLVGGLPRLGILGLLALATALIYGLIGRINLAFGEFAALGGIATSLVVVILTIGGVGNPALAGLTGLVGALALGGLYGAAMGRVVLWPLSTGKGQPLLVAGVGLLVSVQEGLRLAQGAGTLWLPPVDGEAIILAWAPDFPVMAHPRLLLMAALDGLAILITLVVMDRTPFGRAWRASADDPFAASLCGIDPKRLLIAVSALATLLASLAGATIALNYGGMHFSGGTMLGLTGLIAAILGGIGSLGGAVLGAVAIWLFQIGWSATQKIAHWELATFTLLTIALVLKPGGFFGFADGAERKA
jgi:branched-chain amino acid transport system permease protein